MHELVFNSPHWSDSGEPSRDDTEPTDNGCPCADPFLNMGKIDWKEASGLGKKVVHNSEPEFLPQGLDDYGQPVGMTINWASQAALGGR